MSDGGPVRLVPRRARDESKPMEPEELQRALMQLMAEVKSDPVSWALTVGKQVYDRPDPPMLERTGVPGYLDNAPEALRVAAQRVYARGEAERDLRGSMRAEVILRGTEHTRQLAWLVDHHIRRWHIAHVAEDLQQREEQLRAALDRRYGR